MYKVIIFDLDGTLIDSVEGIKYAMNKVLCNLQLPCHDTKAYEQFLGEGLKRLVYKALPKEHQKDERVEKYYKLMLHEYAQNWSIGMRRYDGIESLLNALTERKIKLAINTNKNDEITQEIVKKYLSEWEFVRVIGDKRGKPRKPNPSSAMDIVQACGVSPSDCIYLGDSEVDIETAKNAGMCQVSATWGFRTEEQLKQHSPQRLIRKPMELLKVIE